MKKHFLVVISLTLAFAATAQHKNFETIIKKEGCPRSFIRWIVELQNGNFLIYGTHLCEVDSLGYYWGNNSLFLLAPDGTFIAQQDTGLVGMGVRELHNNNLLFFSHDNDSVITMIKTDAQLKHLWQKQYYLKPECRFWIRNVIQTADQGYAIIGFWATGYCGFPVWSTFLLKLDAAGNQEWFKIYTAPKQGNNFETTGIQEIPNKGFALFGWTGGYFGDGLHCLMRTNTLGDTLWQRIYEYPQSYGDNICLTQEGGFMLNGSGEAIRYNHLIKTDSLGNVLWKKNYLPYTQTEQIVIPTYDNGFAIAVNYREPEWTGPDQTAIIKTDADGNIQWLKKWNNYFYDFKQTRDSSFILTGTFTYIQSGFGSREWGTVLKFDTLVTHSNEPLFIEPISTFPNPTSDYITISVQQKIDEIFIYNILGIETLNIETPQQCIFVGNLPSGFYYIIVKTAASTYKSSFIKQ